MKELTFDWAEFKAQADARGGCIQEVSTAKYYDLYFAQQILLFHCNLPKNDTDFDSDVTDYEDNYQANANLPLEERNRFGVITSSVSPRPCDKFTYFSGAGDNAGVGAGPRAIFDVLTADSSKLLDLEFDEDISLKDCVILMKDAPLGSYIDIEIVHPTEGVIESYLKKYGLLGTGRIDVNSEDQEPVANNLKIRITVYNSDGTGDQDAAADFQVVVNFEMYRTTTV